MEKLIITVAPVGSVVTREKNPNIPITPREIAESVIDSCQVGASVCHIHVRNPKTEEPSSEFVLYKEVFERIRDNCDIIINLSTGPGARFFYSPGAPEALWDTSQLKSPEERVAHVLRLKPEICSLDVGTLNFNTWAFVNILPVVKQMATLIKQVGTKPELEVFDIGHIRMANFLMNQGIVVKPPIFQLCLGVPWGIEANVENLVYMRNNLPSDAIWSSLGIGRHHFTMTTASIIMGGHVRVGLEDNIYIKKNVLASNNAEMVNKIAEIARFMDRGIATPTEAREILGLK